MAKQHEREKKVLPVYVTKADAEQGIVDAVVSVFGIVDDGQDYIPNGAFVKTLTERGRKVRVLDAHKSWSVLDVIGRPLLMKEVGRDELPTQVLDDYPEATGGLFTSTQYLLNTPEGKGAFDRIVDGAVNEFSIGYEVTEKEYRKMEWRGQTINARVLKQIKLWEYSPVVWGMNPATAVVGAKGQGQKEMTGQNAVIRLGDYLQAKMRYVADMCANNLLMNGTLSNDEYKQVRMALDSAMATFEANLPETLALTELSNPYSYYYDSADDPDGQKSQSDPAADPPTLPTGLPDAAKPEDKTKDEAGQQPQAGPGAQGATPPTDDARKRMLLLIDAELDEIDILEAT